MRANLLLEVDQATGFTDAFTHLRTGAPCKGRIGLLNALLAEGINLGLNKMAQTARTSMDGHPEERNANDPAVPHLEMDDNVPGREHEFGRPPHAMSVMFVLAL